MDSNFTRMMDLCLEIEGLISLADSRRNAAPGRLYDLLQLKASSLLDEVRALGAEMQSAPSVPSVPRCDADELAEADVQAMVAAVDFEQKEDATDTVADNLAVELNPVPPADDMADVDVNIPQPTEVHDLAEEIAPAIEPSESPESVITLADTIEAPSSRNEALLSGEFSLNDKFRFRRSLFSSNDREMAEALAVADSMNSVADLEDYFYNDLCWDARNPEVADFMRILTRRLEK